jgi:hypothetical protein
MDARLVSRPHETRIRFAVRDPGEEARQALTGMARAQRVTDAGRDAMP